MTQTIDLADGNPPNVRRVTAKDVTVVSQQFEWGVMHWFAPEEDGANGTIFALINTTADYIWWRGEDTWDGTSEPAAEVPEGLFVPGSGFGHAWQEQGFESVLGFAITSEHVGSGWHRALGDGWELWVDAMRIALAADKQWKPPEPEPEPTPEPEPGPEPSPMPVPMPGAVGGWVWLREMNMAVNLEYAAWIDADSLRVGQYDAVLVLPKATAVALRAFIKTLCIEVI